jgi:hypothetical protein
MKEKNFARKNVTILVLLISIAIKQPAIVLMHAMVVTPMILILKSAILTSATQDVVRDRTRQPVRLGNLCLLLLL